MLPRVVSNFPKLRSSRPGDVDAAAGPVVDGGVGSFWDFRVHDGDYGLSKR
jgi:hypothetical protein